MTCPTCGDVLPNVREMCREGSCHGCCLEGRCGLRPCPTCTESTSVDDLCRHDDPLCPDCCDKRHLDAA